MLQRDSWICPTAHAAFRRLGAGGGVILHLETKDFFQLNELGTAIWTLLEKGISFGDLVVRLRQTVQEAPQEFEGEVAAFLGELQTRRLLSVEAPVAITPAK